ncbi:MAG: lasso peptide [Thermosynechococcaceae cyanobacterium]
MKSAYQSPKLIRHGNVETITRAFGPSPAGDTVMLGGSNVSIDIGSTGSIDGIINPNPRP